MYPHLTYNWCPCFEYCTYFISNHSREALILFLIIQGCIQTYEIEKYLHRMFYLQICLDLGDNAQHFPD